MKIHPTSLGKARSFFLASWSSIDKHWMHSKKIVPKLCTPKESVIVGAKKQSLSISFTYLAIPHLSRNHKAYLIAKLPKSAHLPGCTRFFLCGTNTVSLLWLQVQPLNKLEDATIPRAKLI